MFREYYSFIRAYLKLSELKKSHLLFTILTAIFYKACLVALPLFAAGIVQNLTDKNSDATYFYLIEYLVTYILYIASLYIDYILWGYSMNHCYHRMTVKILNKLITVDNNFTRLIGKGRLMNSITGDITSVGGMNDQISEFFTSIVQIVATIAIVGFFNIYVAIIFIFFTIVYIWARNKADRRVNIYHKKVVVDDDEYSNLLGQIVSGLQEIKTFNMLPKLKTKLNTIQKKFTKDYLTKRKYMTFRGVDIKIITYTIRFLLYFVSIILMSQGQIDIGTLVLIIAYHESLVDVIGDFVVAADTIRETSTAVSRVDDILNYKSDEINFGAVEIDDIYGAIEFKNVSLHLGGQDVLKNINLKIGHNEVVAIVGEAGAGKTMLFNLLLRLYKPTKGKITLDDINIYDFSKDVYTSNVSVANQKPFIFNMSIRKNLNFVDRNIEHQIEACKKAGIHDFITSLPDGYNTILRENGSNVSGGQKQMISIARTVLSDAEILLLDDITTSLDPDTAKLAPRLIENFKKDHTIIMITKKPELMAAADRIVVLNQGKIDDVGTHSQLIKRNVIYQNLWSRKSPSKVRVFDND